jgi:hypothetical protein
MHYRPKPLTADPTIHPRSAATNGILEMIQMASAERHDGGVVEVL